MSHLMNTYARLPVAFSHGEGSWITDTEGKRYLDALSGIAVSTLGHNHPTLVAAIAAQAGRVLHTSNLYRIPQQEQLADKLTALAGMDEVFFCNSGCEANEAAIKLARKGGGEGRYEIISLEGSFHGRTLAAVAATGQAKFHKGFEPLPAGFIHAPFGDLGELEKLITPQTCAILCEPLQGEGGVRPLPVEYLKGIRALCDKHNLLLILDEVQVGMGRTGTLFAYEQFGITPDIITLAKALGNGLPIGALLTSEKVAAAFEPGSHASTFGGNPVACAAAVVVMQTMLDEGFLAEVRAKGEYLASGLNDLSRRFPTIGAGARGMGLIQGLALTPEFIPRGGEIVNRLFDAGVLANFAGGLVLRFLPPLVVSRDEIDELLAALARIFAEMAA